MRVDAGDWRLGDGTRKRGQPSFGLPFFRIRAPKIWVAVAVEEGYYNSSALRDKYFVDGLPVFSSDWFGEGEDYILIWAAIS